MRGSRLAHRALAVIAISIPAAGMAAGVSAGTANAAVVHKSSDAKAANAAVVHKSFDQRAATYVKSLEGVQYTWGGTSRAGFDCSGLTQYVYGRLGRHIARTAEDQFRQFRPISKARAWGGDLVFFHVTSNPASYVYHVAIYEGGNSMVAASSGGGQVIWESLAWAGNTVTFGTITH
jgi:cell wall-associated NlpC family hydrolase